MSPSDPNLREQIIKADDITSETVDVPEWNVKVEVRTLSGRDRAKMLKSHMDSEGVLDIEKLYPALLIAAVFDPDSGDKVFTEFDYDVLNNKSGAALERVAQVAIRLSGLGGEAVAEAGKGSSSPATPDSSPSDDSS